MEIFVVTDEKDPEYSTYAAAYKAAAKILNEQGTFQTFSDQIRQIREKFQYFERTNPKVMAIAMYIAVSDRTMSSAEIMDLVSRVFPLSQTKNKDNQLLLIDVKRYLARLAPSRSQ